MMMTVTINGRALDLDHRSAILTFDQVRKLAGLRVADTITYRQPDGRTGTVCIGESVAVQHGTILNVAVTSGA